MFEYKTLKLQTEKEKNIRYNKLLLKSLKKEVEDLIIQINDFNVANELYTSLDFEMGKDQQNLATGYSYIIGRKPINKDNVKELYDILSEGLLDDYSLENMGKYYRNKDAYILDTTPIFMDRYTKGIEPEKVESKMEDLFEYINKNNETDIIEKYIKSQVIHYYMAYIHPYYDVNGRCARTLSMWYLLKENLYPFILFNRGIYKNRSDYKSAILRCNNENITPFIEFSLKVLKKELEEYISYEDIPTKRK